LFVVALLLLVSGWRALIGTITAFTLAHSITLTGATLGFVSAPSGLIEALIALSIVFVAAEALHKMRGQESLTTRRPWLIAFAFGLLHGFGFAGALSEVGLPDEAIPAALLFFNVGVELGQLLFVATFVLLAKALQAIASPSLRPLRIASSYVIGSLAGFWTVERVLALWV
ncbi:MAG: HupE/UreJ family protein, partial [Limibacillus sp.]